MPILVENIKNYFKTLELHAIENNFHDFNNKEEIKDIEIHGLYTDVSVNNALIFINDEFLAIKSLSKDLLKKSAKQHLRSIELMIVIYQLHGQFISELNSIKFYRNLCTLSCDLEERNYAYSLEAFWHLIHDTKSCIPEKSVELCKNIIINNHNINERSNKKFIVTLAKLIFRSSNLDPNIFDQITELKATYKNYFDKCTMDSFQTRSSLAYYEHILKIKMFNSNCANDDFDFMKNALIIRKISLKSIDYLRSKNADLKLHSGSYETLLYLWKYINNLLIGLEIIAEFYTLMGIEMETKKFQYDFFSYSVKYCVPFRTKIAVRLMMHNEFIYLRLPELVIRDAQLNQIRKKLEILDNSDYRPMGLEHDVAEYHYGMIESKNDYFNIPFEKPKKNIKSSLLSFVTCINEEKEIGFEECFLSKSTFRVDLMDIFNLVKSYIWEIEPKTKKFSVCNEWQNVFIQHYDDQENLLLNLESINLSTPPSSPKKCSSSKRKIFENLNAPIRQRRKEPLVNIPMIIQKKREPKEDFDLDESGCNPIESFSTVFLPSKKRNIKYEDPELPRSMIIESKSVQVTIFQKNLEFFKCLSLQDVASNHETALMDGPSLIKYFEDHVEKFKYMNVPVIHRPLYQRLGLHYLLIDKKKAAYYLSLAINIGFRQLYVLECSIKLKLSERWNKTNEIINRVLKNENEMHSKLEELLPEDWTVLQFSMIDEMSIRGIKSSLLNNSDGGCFGARNCAVLLVTKYQKLKTNTSKSSKLVIETRVMHGFRKTGLQLMDQLEHLKAESVESLKITERKQWWAKRFSIDSKLKLLTEQMRNDWFSLENLEWMMDMNTELESEPKILITDRNICRLPVECLLIKDYKKAHCITRMPNMLCLIGHLYQCRFRNSTEKREKSITKANLEIDPFKTFFLVNPDNTLPETEDTILPLFQSKLNWEGITGNTLNTLNPINVLSSKDMIIYCGHGAGYRYFMHRSIKSVTSSASFFLMGCQSARFIVEGRSEAFGMIMYYLTIGCPSVMGLLWDVTDKEIDKFTMKMLMNWLKRENNYSLKSETYVPAAPLPSYLFNHDVINNVQLKSLTGNSAVIFGLPTWIDIVTDVPDL